jgi:hypothetical protein
VPDPYSPLLLAAGVAAVAALLLGAAVRVGLHRARLVQWVPLASGLSLLALGAAAALHLFLGHGPGSPEPMDPLSFFGGHPAVILIAALALLALGIGQIGRRI